MTKFFFITVFSLFLQTFGIAQIERSIFEAYDLDSIEQIHINIADSVNIEFWPGDNILVESNIAFYNGNKSMFERLIKAGRYNLLENRTSQSLSLSEGDKIKKKIAGVNGEICYETVERTIYIPEDYALSGSAYIKVKEE